jgi:hypothetical protein
MTAVEGGELKPRVSPRRGPAGNRKAVHPRAARMSIPLTIRCECGETLSATLGETKSCSCGRRYDTSSIPPDSLLHVRATQARLRLYARIGFILTVASALIGFVVYGLSGAVAGGCLAAIVWWRVVRPRLQRRREAELANVRSWTLEAE